VPRVWPQSDFCRTCPIAIPTPSAGVENTEEGDSGKQQSTDVSAPNTEEEHKVDDEASVVEDITEDEDDYKDDSNNTLILVPLVLYNYAHTYLCTILGFCCSLLFFSLLPQR
jgi:hypothetical protein